MSQDGTREDDHEGKQISQAKLDANRGNAKHSSGPRSEKGKGRVRFNAVKHGLTAKALIIPGLESRKTFKKMLRRLRKELKPQGMLEELAVEEIAAACFRLPRVYRSEATAFATAAELHRRRVAADYEDVDDDEEGEDLEGHFTLPRPDVISKHAEYEDTMRRRVKKTIEAFEKLQRARRDAKEEAAG